MSKFGWAKVNLKPTLFVYLSSKTWTFCVFLFIALNSAKEAFMVVRNQCFRAMFDKLSFDVDRCLPSTSRTYLKQKLSWQPVTLNCCFSPLQIYIAALDRIIKASYQPSKEYVPDLRMWYNFIAFISVQLGCWRGWSWVLEGSSESHRPIELFFVPNMRFEPWPSSEKQQISKMQADIQHALFWNLWNGPVLCSSNFESLDLE